MLEYTHTQKMSHYVCVGGGCGVGECVSRIVSFGCMYLGKGFFFIA